MIDGMDSYTVVLAWDADWVGYVATCPAMQGAVSQGKSRDEALANIREAMLGWVEVADEPGLAAMRESAAIVADGVTFALNWQAEEGWPLRVETATVTLPTPVAA